MGRISDHAIEDARLASWYICLVFFVTEPYSYHIVAKAKATFPLIPWKIFELSDAEEKGRSCSAERLVEGENA